MNERTRDEGTPMHYDDAVMAVARMLGEQAFDNAMGGSMQEWYGVDVDGAARVLSAIYGKRYIDVSEKLHTYAEAYKKFLHNKQAEQYRENHS